MGVCCADELEWAGARSGRCSGRKGSGSGPDGGASGEILSELFGGVEGVALQVELWGVRILFELLGFLLKDE